MSLMRNNTQTGTVALGDISEEAFSTSIANGASSLWSGIKSGLGTIADGVRSAYNFVTEKVYLTPTFHFLEDSFQQTTSLIGKGSIKINFAKHMGLGLGLLLLALPILAQAPSSTVGFSPLPLTQLSNKIGQSR